LSWAWREERGRERKGDGPKREGKRSWAREREREWAELMNGFSIFLFSKILNSADFCLFHCEITKAPKIIKFFV
jgi:hypothetical protein